MVAGELQVGDSSALGIGEEVAACHIHVADGVHLPIEDTLELRFGRFAHSVIEAIVAEVEVLCEFYLERTFHDGTVEAVWSIQVVFGGVSRLVAIGWKIVLEEDKALIGSCGVSHPDGVAFFCISDIIGVVPPLVETIIRVYNCLPIPAFIFIVPRFTESCSRC